MVPVLKLFWKENCANCPQAKKFAKEIEGYLKVEFHNADTPEGLAEATFYDILSTPSFVLVDDTGRELKSWHGKIPSKDEILELIK